jgi:hypothetical protein
MQGSQTIKLNGKSKKPKVSNKVVIDPANPIPFKYGSEIFSIVHEAAYLPFLPPKDDFAKNLIEARLLSPTANQCIITKKDYCAGDGFEDSTGQDIPKDFVVWCRSMNLKNQSSTKITKNIFEDYFTYGNVPIELVRFTVGGKKKLFVYAHSFLEWRLGKPDENDIVQYAVQSKLFLRERFIATPDQIKKSKRLPIYNPNNREKDNWQKDQDDRSVERTLIWYKNPITGLPHYGLPSNIATMIPEVLEYKGARFNLDEFENGMVPSGVLALKGNLGQEEADKIGKRIISTHAGDGKRARIFVVASEEGIEGSDLHKLDTQRDGSYNESDALWSQKIIMGNDWDAVLMGVLNASTLGKGSGFITKVIEHKLKTVILPAQRDIMDEVWNTIITIADNWIGFGLEGLDIRIKNSVDISGLTDVDITPAVQVNEVRIAKNLPEDPQMKGVYMKATKPQDAPVTEGGGNV